jgi:hypothetical protein
MRICTAILLVLIPALGLAESVVPIDTVQQHVNVRKAADASSEVVGRLKRGDAALLVSTDNGWHKVVLEDEISGYVSVAWTNVIDADFDANEQIAASSAADLERQTSEAAVAEQPGITVDAMVEASVAAKGAPDKEETVDDVTPGETETIVVVEESAEREVEPTPAAVVEPVVSAAVLKGTRNFLVRFRNEAAGGNSQIYDDHNQVGIGTTTPKQRLEVNGSIQIHDQNSSVAGLMITQSTGETGYIMHNRASTLTIGAGSEDRITIDREGNVGMAVSRPKHPLEMASGAHVTQGGVWTNSSSRALKENIVALGDAQAISTLMELEPVLFNYKNESGESYVGFIAEDVPELVAMNARDGLSPMDVVAVLTRVVQDQQKKIEVLEARLDNL